MNNIEFSINKIDEKLYEYMIGKSIPEDYKNDVDIEDLRYIKAGYIGFDGFEHQGELVVNKEVADDVLDIFKTLFENSYKIEKIKLVDKYMGDDNSSMADNNSSAFNYRVIPNTNRLSNHAAGRAIDINPLYNPYIVDGRILPPEGKDYVDRTQDNDKYIKKGDFIYNTFSSHGWSWGGEWTHAKDYQHFDKVEKGE